MANTRLRTKNVGSPCESFSEVSGRLRQALRTRSTCFVPESLEAFEDLDAVALRVGLGISLYYVSGSREQECCRKGPRRMPSTPLPRPPRTFLDAHEKSVVARK